MSFNEKLNYIYDGFCEAVSSCGFKPFRIDEKEHNNQTVPEILYEIRNSRFLIMDITEQNYGAYYEAGYALALGKEVIICCKKDVFESKDKDIRPHFDIQQKSTIIWENIDDLIERLTKRIKATIE